MRKAIVILLAGLVIVGGGIQFIRPSLIGHNPPVVAEPQWSNAEVRQMAQRACFDCHSNETTWYWYTPIAPVSWLVAHDVSEGRHRLNFSDWGRSRERDELSEVVLQGEMPTGIYRLMHPAARLSDAERQALAAGLAALR